MRWTSRAQGIVAGAVVLVAAVASAEPAAGRPAGRLPTDLAWGSVAGSGNLVNFALNDPGVLNPWGTAQRVFLGGVEFDNGGTFTTLYGIGGVATTAELWAFDTATGNETIVGNATAFGSEGFTDLATDPVPGQMYTAGCDFNTSTSSLYTLDLSVDGATRIGPITNSACVVGLAIQPGTGQMYGTDFLTGNLLTIDKATGAGTIVGPLGFDVSPRGMDFDDSDGTLYLFAFNDTTLQGELRIVDLTTGATTLVGPFPVQSITAAIAAIGPSTISIGDVAAVEGNLGTGGLVFLPVTLSPPSATPVTVHFDTVDGTATVADFDYLPVSGDLTFAPGQTFSAVTVSVIGDVKFEHDETYFVSLSNAVGATILDGIGEGLIINDDILIPSDTRDELLHATRETVDLFLTSRFWRISQKARSSYEVVTDATTGDIGPGGPDLRRLAADETTVLQSGASTTGGSSKSMRFENPGSSDNDGEFIQVRSEGCGNDCDTSDTIRIRAYDTTYRIARFNNSATQVTVLMIANPTDQPTAGTLWFRAATGALLTSQAVTIPAHGSFVLNTSTVGPLQGQAGSATLSNDAAFGALTGKAVAVEPATGFTFDTPMVPR